MIKRKSKLFICSEAQKKRFSQRTILQWIGYRLRLDCCFTILLMVPSSRIAWQASWSQFLFPAFLTRENTCQRNGSLNRGVSNFLHPICRFIMQNKNKFRKSILCFFCHILQNTFFWTIWRPLSFSWKSRKHSLAFQKKGNFQQSRKSKCANFKCRYQWKEVLIWQGNKRCSAVIRRAQQQSILIIFIFNVFP